MPSVYNEEVVETLGADSPDEALRISIRVRCSKWGQKDLGTPGSADLVEADPNDPALPFEDRGRRYEQRGPALAG
jgi:hypothetical protein